MGRLCVALACCILGGSAAADAPKIDPTRLPPAAKETIDFVRDIQPIFAKHCLACHGPTKQRGGLRLDDGSAAGKGGNSGPILVPGKPAESRLLILVSGLDSDLVMPPKEKAPLGKADLGRLRAWIEQGAKWPQAAIGVSKVAKSNHWAFQPIRAPAPPAVINRSWANNEIDRFILARLEKEEIAPSPEADPVTLIRRLSFDLVGLPPTPAQVDDFVADWAIAKPQAALERLVDRLLASPHYGERWGRHWLDLARYADSDGYEADRPRPYQWRYRDWVIDALNRDMPFDQFTIEQLAGDLLPGASLAQKTATGFHRNTLTNREGGADKEQFRVEACIDRVNTTAKVWLGFLPTHYAGTLFRSQGEPVLNLNNPAGLSGDMQRRTIETIGNLNRLRRQEIGDPEINSRTAAYELAFRMQAAAPELIDLSGETRQTLDMYGIDRTEPAGGGRGGGRGVFRQFATNCLLARRLVERGVRFVNLYHASWDHHSNLNPELAFNCQMADQPVAALIKDLKRRGLLDSTLVLWLSEFGRTPLGENRGGNPNATGRDHHPFAFTIWMAGGGVSAGHIHGATDELGWGITRDPVHINDFHATLLHLFGLDHLRLTYRYQGRDFRLTDVGGRVVRELLG